ncbi:MAG TPA: hypothetical protein PL157_16990, partial [Acidobacteriota bacterium]|nr:hypothetical protein [Acidobacteriota bacterium]
PAGVNRWVRSADRLASNRGSLKGCGSKFSQEKMDFYRVVSTAAQRARKYQPCGKLGQKSIEIVEWGIGRGK